MWCIHMSPKAPDFVEIQSDLPHDGERWAVKTSVGEKYFASPAQLIDGKLEHQPNPQFFTADRLNEKIEVKVKPQFVLQHFKQKIFSGKRKHPCLLANHVNSTEIDLHSIYDSVSRHFGMKDGIIRTEFESFDECRKYIKEELHHLDQGYFNVFSLNSLKREQATKLFLHVKSLHNLVSTGSDGWIDDSLLNFVSEMCNFYHSFNKEKKHLKKS